MEDVASNGAALLVNIMNNIPILMKNTYLAKLTAPWFNELTGFSAGSDQLTESVDAAPLSASQEGGTYTQPRSLVMDRAEGGVHKPLAAGKDASKNASINKIAAKLDELRRK